MDEEHTHTSQCTNISPLLTTLPTRLTRSLASAYSRRRLNQISQDICSAVTKLLKIIIQMLLENQITIAGGPCCIVADSKKSSLSCLLITVVKPCI